MEKQTTLEGMSDINMIERMGLDEREVIKAHLLNRISDYEKLIHLINDVTEAEGRKLGLEA